MCHAYLAGTLFGRDSCHSAEFLAMEKQFRGYQKAAGWERENVDLFFA